MSNAVSAVRGDTQPTDDQSSSVAAKVIAEIVERLGRTCTPAVLVEESRPKSAPLHGRFEWDDSVAGERFRVIQAMRIIQRVVTFERIGNRSVQVRAYVCQTAEPEDCGSANNEEAELSGASRTYRPIGDVLKSAEMRSEMLKQALRELRQWEKRYCMLKELAVVRLAAARVYAKYDDE